MTCPQEPLPIGWRYWRGAVPTPLEQFAIDIRDHINNYQYGRVVATTSYNGQSVGVFKSHHRWTFRRMPDGSTQLVQNICIPGCALVVPVAAGTQGVGGTLADNLDTPDPTAAVYGADDVPIVKTNWGTVALTAVAAAAIVAAFAAALHYAGKP